MKKINPTIPQLRTIVQCYFKEIAPGYSKQLEIIKEKNTRLLKEYFSAIYTNYTHLSKEEQNLVDNTLIKNNCVPLKDLDTDEFLTTGTELEKNAEYKYLSDFCKYIQDIKYFGYTENYPLRIKEDPIFFEDCLSRALDHIKKEHKDIVNVTINVYLELTARAITTLPPSEFNRIDELARENGILTIKEAFDKFPVFRKEFKEQKQSIESPEYLDWRGTGEYFSKNI